jgi:PAS domain S-box-containing protein
MLTLGVASMSAGDSTFSQEEAVKRVKRVAAEGPQLFEWHCRDSAGRLFWAEVNLSYARLGSGDRVLAFVRDIDSRKQAEQRVLQLSRLLEGIMDTVDMWVSAADADGKILVWNAAAEAISGYSREEVIGSNNVWKLMYPEASIREKYMAERWAALRSGVKCDRHRTSIVTGRGESRWICWNYYPLSDEAGNLCGAVALAFDVTDAAGEGHSAPDLAGHAPRVMMKDIS